AKIGLVIFLASYLRDTRQVLVTGARRILGVTIPPIKHFGPVLVIWGIAMFAFALGAWYLGTHIAHVHARVEDWMHPFNPTLYHAPLGSYQIANGIFAQA